MTLESISHRQSAFIFSDIPVRKEDIYTLFEAARLAPSSMNAQPWHFIYASKHSSPAEHEVLFSLLSENNKAWAFSAPLFVLTLAREIMEYKNKPNAYAWHDTGMATGLLLIQAMEMGIHSHPMGGFDKEKAREILSIPGEYSPVAMIALGYPGDISLLPNDLQEKAIKPRSRKDWASFVSEGKFTE
jgi:nitroreductase